MNYELFDFKSILPKDIYSKEQCHLIMNDLVRKKIPPHFSSEGYIRKRALVPFLQSIFYYTSFLIETASIKERLFCFKNNISTYPKCHLCFKPSTHFNGNFTKGYYSKFCSRSCNRKSNNPFANKSEEEKIDMHRVIGNKRRGKKFDDIWINNLKKAASRSETKLKKKQTCLKRYGVENPGILGAYHSKAATIFIRNFILTQQLDIDCCYYFDKDLNKKEFFQYIPEGKLYTSYDLVVFTTPDAATNKDIFKINLVLEYNGPWHYFLHEIRGHEHEPAVPYKNSPNIKTKKETYEFDLSKLEYISKYCSNVLIYWEKTKELLKYEHQKIQ